MLIINRIWLDFMGTIWKNHEDPAINNKTGGFSWKYRGLFFMGYSWNMA
jgi:hypothetical protein